VTTSDQEDQAERRRVLLQDDDLRRQQQEQARETGTYLSHTHDDTSGGRFAATGVPHVIGSTGAPTYPQLPSSSPWSGSDPVPQEPSLGYCVNDLSPHELEPSINQAELDPALESPTGVPIPPPVATDDPAHAPSGGSLVQQPSGGLVSERAGSSFSQLGDGLVRLAGGRRRGPPAVADVRSSPPTNKRRP